MNDIEGVKAELEAARPYRLCAPTTPNGEATMTEAEKIAAGLVRELDRAIERIMGVEIEAMRGDNLAVLLCGHFDDPDDGSNSDDCGWSQTATDAYDEIKREIAGLFVPVREQIAAVRAAIAESLRRGDQEVLPDGRYAVASYVTEPLRNLDQPKQHGTRSDGEACSAAWVKGAPCDCQPEGDPVSKVVQFLRDQDGFGEWQDAADAIEREFATPTQPEVEDALVEALDEAGLVDPDWTGCKEAADRLRQALASRGLVVRGEGVER